MQIAHDDLIDCIERCRVVEVPKLLHDGTPATHEVIAADVREFVRRGGSVQHARAGELGADSGMLPQTAAYAARRRADSAMSFRGTPTDRRPVDRSAIRRRNFLNSLADPRWLSCALGDEWFVPSADESRNRVARIAFSVARSTGRKFLTSKQPGGTFVRRVA